MPKKHNIKFSKNVILIDPVGYLEMVWLLDKCNIVLTDSGGLQKEAYFFSKPCVTMREETEWVELVDNGFNCIAGSNTTKITTEYKNMMDCKLHFEKKLFGNGDASKIIINAIEKI